MLLDSLHGATNYAHIFIAPHLDDAVLSCGGQIAQLRAAGVRTLAVTVCAASPPASEPLTPYAEHLHRSYNLGDDPTARRREEDAEALAILGCDGLHLDQLDAPYRLAAYGVRGAVFNQPKNDDPLYPEMLRILDQLQRQQPTAHLYLPLGVGSHVDHLVVFAAGLALREQGANITWYEDVPYAVQPELVTARLEALDNRFKPQVVLFGTETLGRKLAAVAAYRSQLPKLFKERPMEQVMTEYAASTGGQEGQYSERQWVRHEAR